MRKYLLIFIFLFSIWTPLSFAEETTGIIPGQIWYSKDTLTEGDTVKIYTAIWNNNSENLNAKVEFYDKKVILGTRDIVVSPFQVKEVSVSWNVTVGDHVISAKIISSSISNQKSSEKVTLTNVTTKEDRKFIPVVVKNIDGTPAASVDVVKSQIDKANSKIGEIIPNFVSQPVSSIVGTIDVFRDETASKIAKGETNTKIQIAQLEKNTLTQKDGTKSAGSTDKPIAYIILFFLSVASFIFNNKIVFYGLIVLYIFFILRFIYLKLRYR